MTIPWESLADELGPGKVVFVREPRLGLEGIVVVDNVACGPASGAVVVAVADSRGALLNPGGLPLADLRAFKERGGSVGDFPAGQPLPRDDIPGVDCDIFIPAARPDALTAANAPQLKAKLVLQGANIPATREAEAQLAARGVLSVPDFIANAGGVICAAVEYHGGTQAQAFAVIEEKLRENMRAVLARARQQGQLSRTAAEELARARVVEAMGYRRH